MLPFLFAFVGIFGGIAKFGLVGLFVGPRHLAALLTVWREWIVPPRNRRSRFNLNVPQMDIGNPARARRLSANCKAHYFQLADKGTNTLFKRLWGIT